MNENEKYNLPCPYDLEIMCVQMPCPDGDDNYSDNYCDNGCPQKEKAMNRLAEFFHETYERLAPDFSYETRKASAKPWAEVPENNKNLMMAVAGAIYDYLGFYKLKAELDEAKEENKRLRDVLENAKAGLLEAQGSLSELGKDGEVNFDGYFERIKQALKGE